MGKYDQLNVLAIKQQNFMSDDAITKVANMIKATGDNRSQRRRLEKSLGKMQTILEHSQKYVDRSAYKEYQKCLDENYVHFFACLALTMGEDYKWKEDETHNQISSILQRVDKKIKKLAEAGYSTTDIIQMVDDKYDITLQAK